MAKISPLKSLLIKIAKFGEILGIFKFPEAFYTLSERLFGVHDYLVLIIATWFVLTFDSVQ